MNRYLRDKFIRDIKKKDAVFEVINQPFFCATDVELAHLREVYGLNVVIFSQDTIKVGLFTSNGEMT